MLKMKKLFGMRKTKKYGLCAVALGMLVLGNQVAFADENVAVPATPTVEKAEDAVTTSEVEEVLEKVPVTTPSVTEVQPTTDQVSSPVVDVPAPADSTAPATTTVAPTEEVKDNVDASTLKSVPEATEATKKVANKTTATITPTGLKDGKNPFDIARFDVKVSTTLTEEAKAGDYVEYNLDNLPYAGLNGLDVAIADGTVIGKLKLVKQENPRSVEMDGSKDAKANLELGTYSTVYHVIFNDGVNDLQDVVYSFEIKNGPAVLTYGNKEWDLVSKVSSNGQEVTRLVTKVAALPKEDDRGTLVYQSSSRATYTKDSVDGTMYNTNVQVDGVNPVVKGDVLTVNLSDNAGIAFDLDSVQVGKVFTIQDVGSNNELATVNKNGVILFNDGKYRFEVISVSDKSITYKALDSLPSVDGRYGGLYHKFVLTDASKVDFNNNVIKDIPVTGILSGSDGKTKSTFNQTVSIPISGTAISASALVIPKSNVYVQYLAEDGTVLQARASVVSNVKYGTAYDTDALEFAGYVLTEEPGNAEGVTGKEDIVVTYVYSKVKTPDNNVVIEEPKKDEDVPPTPTVEKPTLEIEVPPTTPVKTPPVEAEAQPAAVLPNTGEAGSILSLIGGIMLSGLGAVGLRKRNKEE